MRRAALEARGLPLETSPRGSALEVLAVATRLGLTAFGGPIAHFGYYHAEYVVRRRWLDDARFADLVALCQVLPGPASSQVGIAIGTLRAGPLGGLAAFVGFTLPSAIALVAFAYLVRGVDAGDAGWLNGLKVAAVAVVAHALISMARRLTPDVARAAIAGGAAAIALVWEGVPGQLVPLAAAAVVGLVLLRGRAGVAGPEHEPVRGRRRVAAASLVAFLALLAALPLARQADGHAAAVADAFYRAGALVFGGGHVVLPLLHAEVVPRGWVTDDDFVAGYGLTQAMPGPLFNFAAYLGAVMKPEPNGVPGAALALTAIYLPSFLLLAAALPFWDALRRRPGARAALVGVNAAVVGLLAAAFWDPLVASAIGGADDALLAVTLFALLAWLKLPPWVVVAVAAIAGAGIASL